MKTNLPALELLLKASSKKVVDVIMVDAFFNRDGDGFSPARESMMMEQLGCDVIEATQLFHALNWLIRKCMYTTTTPDEHLPADFHPQLKDMLGAIVAKKLPDWKVRSLPRMPAALPAPVPSSR